MAQAAKVGERRRFGDQIAEWDGEDWVPVGSARHPAAIFADKAMGMAPFVAGTVGAGMGALGGPGGAVAGGALGGAAGEAFRQLYERSQGRAAPETSGEAAMAVGGQGALYGGTAAAGAGMAKAAQAAPAVLGPVARWLSTPGGAGMAAGAEELYRTKDPAHAAAAGVAAGLGVKHSGATRGMQKLAEWFAKKRAGGVVATEAAEAVAPAAASPAGAPVAAAADGESAALMEKLRQSVANAQKPPMSRVVTPPPPELVQAGQAIEAKIIELRTQQGLSPAQIAAALREMTSAPGSGFKPLRPSEAKKMVEMVLQRQGVK